MRNGEIIQLQHFKELLFGTQLPLGGKVRESLVGFLTADSKHVGQAYREQRSEEVARAESEEEQLQVRANANQKQLNEADERVRGMFAGSWLMGAVSLTCFFLCFAAEYVFNAAVVPWLVSVPSKSLLGIALSMAPATAPVILDRVIVALFDVHDSWQVLRSALLTPLNRIARGAVRIAFFAAVGLLNLHAIWLLADARGVASFLKNSDGTTAITTTQQDKVNNALLMVSIAVTVDGALFYLFGLYDMHAAHKLNKARHELRQLRSAQHDLEEARSAAATKLAGLRRAWEGIDDLQQSWEETYFAEGMVQLEEKSSAPGPVRTAREVAMDRLSRASALAPVRANA